MKKRNTTPSLFATTELFGTVANHGATVIAMVSPPDLLAVQRNTAIVIAPAFTKNEKLATKLEKIAETMQKRIDFCFQDRQVNTRKRIEEDRHFRREAQRLQAAQAILRAAASFHRTGKPESKVLPHVISKDVAVHLQTWITRADARVDDGGWPEWTYSYIKKREGTLSQPYKMLASFGVKSDEDYKAMIGHLRDIVNGTVSQETRNDVRIRELMGKVTSYSPEGWFPTPEGVLALIEEHLPSWQPGMMILEPSAGNGAIADFVRDVGIYQGRSTVHCIERNHDLLEILKLKGYEIPEVDCTKYQVQKYHLAVMNPPFERGQDINHVLHVFEHNILPGGKIIAVMAAAVKFRDTALHSAFREFVNKNGGSIIDLPNGAFANGKHRATGVSTVLCVINKPE